MFYFSPERARKGKKREGFICWQHKYPRIFPIAFIFLDEFLKIEKISLGQK